MGGGGFQPPSVFGPRSLPEWSEGLQILVQFTTGIDNASYKFWESKGCPKKIGSMFFEAGVKNQKFKVGPIGLKFSGVL